MSELFKNGPHRHLNADSTNLSSYKEVMDGAKAKLILADPPYCLLVRRNKKTGQKRDEKVAKINHEAVKRYENVREYRKFTHAWMKPAAEQLEDDGVFIVWTNFLGKDPIKKTAEELGLKYFYGEFAWGKYTTEKASGNEVNVRVYEVALIFSKVPLEDAKCSDAYLPWSVITRYDEEGEAGDWENHPNHKPFSSLEPLIRAYSKVGQRILDPFTGSGSTPAAVIKLGREISGIELRSHWAEISQQRMKGMLDS